MASPASLTPIRRRLTEWVDVYESAAAAGAAGDLADFLPPRGDALYLDVLVELVRIELERGWRVGERPTVDRYVARFPEILASSDALAAVAFEEYRQRLLCGETASRGEYATRYGVDADDWPVAGVDRASLLAASLPLSTSDAEPPASDSLADDLLPVSSRPAAETWPQAGQTLAGFELECELGRGAFARVFLARQRELSNRRVVLKISDRFPGESQAIAQLQHTNIVPIYSQHRVGAWHLLCMPYLGRTTLADALRELKNSGPLQPSAATLLSTLSVHATPTRGPTLHDASRDTNDISAVDDVSRTHDANPFARLRQASYIDGVLWLFLRLAEGLEHAHRRGVLHRDLKLANVLLRDDGEPMLLDFNLAGRRGAGDDRSAAVLGGTLPYMAAEQIRALRGEPVVVDAPADVFSLGAMLYEMLTGERPFATTAGATDKDLADALAARAAPPRSVSQANPQASPAVAAIVARCLAYDPAQRYGTAGDLAEDLQRQLNHQPLRHAANTSLVERCQKWRRRHPRATGVTAVACVAAVAVAAVVSLWWPARQQVAANRARQTLDLFTDRSLDAQFLLSEPDPSSPDRLRGRAMALEALALYDLDADASSASAVGGNAAALDSEDRPRLREELEDLLAALAVAERAATPSDRAAAFPVPAGKADASTTTARECFRNAQQAYGGDQFAVAVEWLTLATARQPRQARYWMLRGRAEAAQLHHDEAIACYTACTVLMPEWAPAYVQRGVARYQRSQYALALADFDKAHDLDASSTAVLVNRALAQRQAGDLTNAIADLDRAIELEPQRTRFYYLRGRMHRRAGRDDLAERDSQHEAARNPRDAEGWLARGEFLLPAHPADSLAAFEAALKYDPHSLDALRNSAHVLSEYLHQPQRAVDALSRAIALYPDGAPAVLGRGVLYARQGRRDLAIADARRGLELDRSATAHYQAACIFALTSRSQPADADEALSLLFTAIHLGFDRGLARRDPDLAPIRAHRDFARLVASPPSTARAR